MIHCHPLQLPFYRVFFGEIQVRDADLVIRWYSECFRKYQMGEKTCDPRWTLNALIEQYTQKIGTLSIP